jgi:hypothetical protein
MSATHPNFEDVWRMFQESDRKFREMSQETSHCLREISQETDRKFREMSQETDRRLREMSQETDRQIRQMSQENSLRFKQASLAIGKLGNRLGDFIEDAVRPSAVRLFRERGIEVHEVHQNVSAQRDGEGLEIDLLVVNEQDVVAIECKSNLKQDDIIEHLERLEKLKRLLPKYADSKIMGAVAAMVIPDPVAGYAYRQGLFVIGQSGDHLEIRNPLNFNPKYW